MEQLFHSHTSSLIYSNATATQLICSTSVTLLNLCLAVLAPLVLWSRPAPPWPVFCCQWSCKVTELVNFDGETMLRTTTQCWTPCQRMIHMIKKQITLLQRDFRLSHPFVTCCQARYLRLINEVLFFAYLKIQGTYFKNQNMQKHTSYQKMQKHTLAACFF